MTASDGAPLAFAGAVGRFCSEHAAATANRVVAL